MSDLAKIVDELPSVARVVQQLGLNAKKSLGQNFLFSSEITNNIARYAGDLSDSIVLEVGPGPGGLTRSILRCNPKKLIVVEKDDRCLPALQQLQTIIGDRLQVISADALSLSLQNIAAGEPVKIIANLPYNIATPLLINWFKQIEYVKSMTLMFQKEVSQRIIATPGNKSFGRLSIIAQWLCECDSVMDLPPEAFSPPPKVSSSVVYFKPKIKDIDLKLFAKLEKLTAAAFGQRRKKIRSSLKKICDGQMLAAANISADLRAENLTVAQFINLARLI